VTFHSGEKNELKDVTKNIKLKIIWLIKNHPNYNALKPNQKLCKNQFRTLPKIKNFGTMKPL
jgi:hypothetical protein